MCSSAQRSSLQEVLTTRVPYMALAMALPLASLNEVRPNDPIYQPHNNDDVLLTAKPSFSNPSRVREGLPLGEDVFL